MTSNVLWYPGHEVVLGNILRAENCYLFDDQGRRYIDLESGVWCTSIGHANPTVVQAITEQSSRLGHTGYCYSNGVVEDAARQVLSLLKFEGGKCVFLCSGSEAVEYGVRTAQTLSSRPLLLTMADSYFGAYGAASSRETDTWFNFDWAPCAQCSHLGSCATGCSYWESIPFSKIGGFLFEPGSSSGMVQFPPIKLIREIVSTVKHNSGIVIVNEVTTGIGRTGAWFGYQHYGFTPDIVALGKGVGNGYPVSVTAFAPEVAEQLAGTAVHYSQSHQNDPLGAAVSLAVIQYIHENKLIDRAREISDMLLGGLHDVQARTGRIREIRGRGLMIAVEVEDDPAATFATWLQQALIAEGFVLARRPNSSVFRIDPSLTIEAEDIQEFLGVLEDLLKTFKFEALV